MKQKLLLFFLLFSFSMQSQCFDCTKIFGGWIGGAVYDLEKTNTAVYVTVGTDLSGANTTDKPGLYKYDLNCNLIWKKEFPNNSGADYFTIDDQGNSYILVNETLGPNYNSGKEPYQIDGFDFYFGITLYKLSPNGNIVWNRKIGTTRNLAKNIFYYDGHIYITGAFNNSININNEILLNDPAYYGRAFIAKFDTAGNLIDAKKYGSNQDIFMTSEIDKNGNIYFARRDPNVTYSSIDKINSNLELVWQKEISNNGNITNKSSYRPTILHYNPINEKLYLWGCFDRTVTIIGNEFTTNSSSNGFFQSILTEFNTSNGNLEHFRQFNNNSLLEYPWEANSRPSSLNKSFMTEKNNELFILSSFSETMTFPNATITAGSNREELVLFKIDLNNFIPEFILKSSGTSHFSNGQSLDAAGPIQFDKNDLFLTSNFQSQPLIINNSVIYGNSGNNESNGLLYKLKFNSSSASGEIIAENTCFNTTTNFEVKGTFDSILWNFDDPNSTSNNIATINNPQHQFTSTGTYHVTATINCGTESQTIEKDISVTNRPVFHTVAPIYSCETISGSGISKSFDTSNINSTIIGNQTDLIIEYIDSNENLLPSPLPNPFTNSIKNEETIKVKSYFQNNPYCFVETNLKLYTISKPTKPTASSPQTFCIQETTTVNEIAITGQNIKWYDTLTNEALLSSTDKLQNGITYYASQTINGCESDRISVLINIQNTPTPTGSANQTFCKSQNPTLDTIVASGTAIQWYDTDGTLLSNSTALQDGITYYASQTENGCESTNKLAIIISLISTLPANDYTELFCDDLNDGSEKVDLSDYNSKLISNTAGYTFSYYSNYSAAENQLVSSQITNFSNFNLALGDNKIYVRINSNTPCYAISELKLTLLSKPKITIPDVVPICENNSITIDAGLDYDTYLWSTGETSSSINVDNPGNYSVTVTNNYATISCSSTKNFEVRQSNIATITSIDTQDWTDNQNTITVYATGAGDFEYSIDGIHFQDEPQFTNIISGQYTVHVRDKNGCGTITDEVYLLMYPKFFTPNGDGFNDTWKIKFSTVEIGLSVKIFDRYGKLIKELTQNNDWDGRFNGQELPATDYWFVVTRANGTEYRGHFSLKR